MLRKCELRCHHHLTNAYKFLLHRSLSCVFHSRSRRSRRRSMNVAHFRFCQTLPTVCPLVAFLATVATLALEHGGGVLVSGTLCFPVGLALVLGLIELAVFRCVAGTFTHEAFLSFCLCQRRQRPSVSHLHRWVFNSTSRPSFSKIRPN